eukprot:TRINITY_DN7759_c0_g1_i2.p1 TRINITY_DN7759_c0_g1~~TRINITY_DN7759_c0_g1_i2.p1  ORF type:complete len:374 (-),score=94.57 TRINITY_DN7759_c0_g1_i2:133-1254(-)
MSRKNLFSMGSLGNSLDFFEDVRVVVVGDHKVGKSSLIQRSINNKFNEAYNKTSGVEKHHWTHVVSDRDVYYTIWDTPGGGSNKVKPLLYAKADVVLLCFKITEPKTLASAFNKWTTDIRNFAPSVPIILVGCQSDLRSNKEIISSLSSQGLAPISAEQGLTVSHQIQAVLYIETSSKSSQRAATSAFEVSALTTMGHMSHHIQQHETYPKTAHISPQLHAPLLPPKYKPLRSPPVLPPKPPVRRAVSSVQLNKENLYTPEPACSAKSLLHLHTSTPSVQPFKVTSRERSLLNLSGTPKTSQQTSKERTVTIKCQRLTLDKRREEVDIEVPAPIYETLRIYNVSSDDLLRDVKNEAPKKSLRAKLKRLFAVKL